jgi:hypothetical protein
VHKTNVVFQVLKFESDYLRENFLSSFDPFLSSSGLKRENITTFTLNAALKKVITKADRQMLLEKILSRRFCPSFQDQVFAKGTVKC